MIFVDTSAWYALLASTDRNHERARVILSSHLDDELLTSSYVVVETMALLHRRLGQAAAVSFHEEMLPLSVIEWIDETLHRAAFAALAAAADSSVSLVDWASFEVMRRRSVIHAFAFDPDFVAAGFDLIG